MWRATLDQMRSSAGRLAAAGVAILLGTAFVAASLLASATMQQATHDAFTSAYADADLVVTSNENPVTTAALADIRSLPQVAATDLSASFGLELTGPAATEYVGVGQTPSDERLAVGTLAEGRDATADGEIVLSQDVADRLGVGLGQSVDSTYSSLDDEGTEIVTKNSFTVVGVLEPASSYFAMSNGGQVSANQMNTWLFEESGTDEFYGSVLLALNEGADVAQVRTELQAIDALRGTAVQTVPEIAEQRTATETGSNVTFLVLMLAFAAVALAVASLVITNTFQVLVAQRTKTLALLRCVGASRSQIRRSVLFEAAVLGVLASLAGLALGTVVVVGGVHVLADLFPGAAIGTNVQFAAEVPIVTLIAGIAVTMLAALVPARMATRVAPVAALRPVEGAAEAGARRGRLVVSATLGVVGALMLAGGVALALATANTDAADYGVLGGLALGVLGGLISVAGILSGSVFLMPKLLPLLGRIAGKSVPSRIATANAIRNPRRTAATTNALVIGVALVVMMSTGAFSARATLLDALDSSFPVDVAANTQDEAVPIEQEQIDAVTQTEGISGVLTVKTTGNVTVEARGDNTIYPSTTAIVDGDPSAVLRSTAMLAELRDGVIVMGDPAVTGIQDGDVVEAGYLGSDGVVELTVATADIEPFSAYITPATMAQIAPDLPVNAVWAQMDDGVDPIEVAGRVQTTLNDLSTQDPNAPILSVGGAALERNAYGQVIDTLLSVVLGLLAVAVVIALVGVANTLSLSVIERRRENATLRAMGLTRGQLRGMLAVEGVLIAAVGAIVGAVAGLLYGWAGAAIVLGGIGDGGSGLRLGVPWPQLGAIAVVALAAGLLASVLPSRSAVKQSPVAALATD